MFINIRSLIPYISKECPLLIETPAGQGTEVLTTFDYFVSFYSDFKEEEREYIKVCIDTCHVFASGFDPLKYLKDFYELYPDSLVLVHYNDSKTKIGSKKDRHEKPGEGFIGVEKMKDIELWCIEKNIPMVIE